MDVDWKANLGQILDLHEHATECQVNKSVSSFQSMGIILTRENICCFFDILSNRMVETCKKVQLSYLTSLDTVQLVDETPSHGNILISVTSTPQCDSKGHSDMVAMDEDASTEDDEQSLPLDASQTDQNYLPNDTRTIDEVPTEESPNADDAGLIECVSTNQLISIVVAPNDAVSSETVESAPVAASVADVPDVDDGNDGNDEISSKTNATDVMPVENDDNDAADENLPISNQGKQDTVTPGQMTLADDEKDAGEVVQIPSPHHVIQTETKSNENDSSMETDEDTLYIDTSGAQIDGDVTMVDERPEITDEKKIVDTEIAAAENTNAAISGSETERKTPSPIALAMPSIKSPPPTSTADQTESTCDSVSVETPTELNPLKPELSEPESSQLQVAPFVVPLEMESCQLNVTAQDLSEEKLQQEPSEPSECESCQQDPSEQEPSQPEPSEQSEFSIGSMQSTASSSLAETEPIFDHQSESGQSYDGNSAGTNSSSGIDKHLLLGDYEKAAAQMINNSLKRKDLPDMDLVCSAAKKYKPSQEVESGAVTAFPAEYQNLPVDQSNYAMIPTKHEFVVPKNADPYVHCQNASYKNRCLICNQIDPSLVNHYRIAHPNADVFISRPSPAMIKRMMDKSGCTIYKDGKIKAFCFFCAKSETMSEMDWRIHLLAHTGELEYYCGECRTQWTERVPHGNCSVESMASIFDNAAAAAATGHSNNSMMLFMCKWCNYVQVHKAHIIRHLEREHEPTTIDTNFNRNIEKVTFIPDLTPISWRISSSYVFVREKDRFICGFPKCTASGYRDFDAFDYHLNDRHSNDTHNFTCHHCHEVIESSKQSTFRLELMKHFRLHGRFIAECAICNQQYESHYKIFNHIVNIHPTESIRYRSIYLEENNDIEKRECTIWLQCKQCGVRVENVAKAMEHFMLEHKSHNMDFNAMKMVKRTKDGTTSCFTPDERKVCKCYRRMVCDTCDMAIKSRSDLLEHYNGGHPEHEIALRPGQIHVSQCHLNDPRIDCVDFTNNLVFYCTHCYDDRTGVESVHRAFGGIQDVHTHWERCHSMMIESKPFQFYAIQFVLCVHCKFIGSFDAVKQHSKALHPNALLAISLVSDTKACTLCPYVGDDLGQHIKFEHELILRTNTINPTRFTGDTLKRLLNEYVHTKYKCCNQLFETEAMVCAHSTMEHPIEPQKYTECTNDNSIKLIAGCCQATLQLGQFLAHLADHNHQVGGVCLKCNFRTSDTFEFVNHQVEVHQIMKDTNLLYRRVMYAKFWSTKVIFGNGLVATKHNLLDTEFDDSTPFKALIETLLTVSRERLHLNQLQRH